jgi:hypothetical protein
VSELGSYIDELEAEDLDATPDASLAQDIVDLFRFADQAQAQALRRLARYDGRMAWRSDGSLSMQAWLRKHCRLSPGAARERVTVARRLNDELPETATAFAAGEISYSHARGIATATTDLRRGRVRAIEPILVDVAREHDPTELSRAVAVWREAADAEAALERDHGDHTARRFHLSQTFEGRWRADGDFDAEGGATITTAINSYMHPDPKGSQPRSPAQRRADALVEMCRQVLDRGDAPVKGGVRPQLNVTVDLETLERRAGAKAADLDWHGPITGETARRLACDAGVSRIITKGKSEILDVGRRTRVVPSAIRRAVIARDRCCVEPGCDRPWWWCDVHHKVHWIDGGRTAVEDLELRCRRHHRDVHEGRARIQARAQSP